MHSYLVSKKKSPTADEPFLCIVPPFYIYYKQNTFVEFLSIYIKLVYKVFIFSLIHNMNIPAKQFVKLNKMDF
jgi:hypothetical protein